MVADAKYKLEDGWLSTPDAYQEARLAERVDGFHS